MDRLLEELNNVKAHNKQLEVECRSKTDLYDSLRKVYNEVLPKLEEAKLQAGKHSHDLYTKSEEISELSKLNEDLKSSLIEKESFLRHLGSANEKLRLDYGDRIQKLEAGNKELVLALDKATARIQELESKVSAANMETESLKRQLSLADTKSLQTKEKAEKCKELKQRDDLILKLEEEHRNIQDQLKWKNEQFQHLEEAHGRNQDHFRSSKAEWEKEKSELVEEMCALQVRLDSEARKSESLEAQLRMCNQALAREESRRKLLEVEVSQYKLRFENVSTECQEAKSQLENLSLKRDEEVANLRNSLATKGNFVKEMEYKVAQLEQENSDLKGSLKEFQEAQISSSGTNVSLKKLQKKIQGLEQLHKKCSVNLKEKEVEWELQIEKVTADMNAYLSELKEKNEQIQELQEELRSGRCLLELYHAVFEMEWCKKESEEKILLLTEQSEIKSHALEEVKMDLNKKCSEAAFLKEKLKSFDHLEQQQNFMEKELSRHKKMHAESSEYQIFLKGQVSQLEDALKDGGDASGALERVNLELSQKIIEADRAECEIKKRESIAGKLKAHLENNLDACRKENENLLCIVKEKDGIVDELQQQLSSLESLVREKTEAIEALKLEKEHFEQVAEDRNSSINQLLNDIDSLRQEFGRRELECKILAKSEAENVFEHEKQSLLQVIKDGEHRIEDLQEQAKSMKQDATNAAISYEEKQKEIDELREALKKADNQKILETEEMNKKIVKLETQIEDLQEQAKSMKQDATNAAISYEEKQKEIDELREALKKADNQKILETEEMNKKIVKLETDITDLCQKLQLKEELLLQSNQQAEQLEVLLNANKLEAGKLMDQFGDERRHLEGLVKKLECEKQALLEDITKLSSHREDVLTEMEGMCEGINEFYAKDDDVMGILAKILQQCDGEKGIVDSPLSPVRKIIGERNGMRSPLMELNN